MGIIIMKRARLFFYIGAIILATALVSFYFTMKQQSVNSTLYFSFPFNKALFPCDFTAPTFNWKDKNNPDKKWIITVNLKNKKGFYNETVTDNKWKPPVDVWNRIKTSSGFMNIELLVKRAKPSKKLFEDTGRLTFKISKDEVGAPILYRQIPLPFSYAESHIDETSYSIVDVTSPKPFHNVLGSFKVCGNCHSISHDGKTIALDFDAVSRDKGGYFISKIDSVTTFNKNNYISWSKMSGRNTFGLLSRISWNGRYIVTTIKDRVVSKKNYGVENIAYSQLFFPVNGVIAVYDTLTKELKELPGANDPNFVQSNAVWTPDDKQIIFARAKAQPYSANETKFDFFVRDEELIDRYFHEKEELKFDLYSIPFNNGDGGEAKPIKGASANGKSNYFPTVSPDGKWLVFCQSNNFMMLRPDSRIYIVPVEGGTAKKLECNFRDMNSWHAWSPNGKWLLFVSKALDIYSDMFLTHIDENGKASIPVLVENAKRPNCAVNYPEFINKKPGYKFTMDYSFINIMDIEDEINAGKRDEAKAMLDKYISQKLGMPNEYYEAARMKSLLGDKAEAEAYYQKGKEMDKEFSKINK
jgi:hypothetical protein